MRSSLPTFFYPTTIAVVDDSINFLSSISLQFNPQTALVTFTSPRNALITINTQTDIESIASRIIAPLPVTDELDEDLQPYALGTESLASTLFNPQRFDSVSVVVVDYDMPEMNGLEFCAALNDKNIYKVLLTGKADEFIAIRAFNEGLIDYYIQKQEAGVIEKLRKAVVDFQTRYFSRCTRSLTDLLFARGRQHMKDPQFIEVFEKLCNDNLIVEYFFMLKPDAFIMRDANGRSWCLTIMDQTTMQHHYEIAVELNAPAELISVLASQAAMPFWEGDEYSPKQNWRECVHPVEVIGTLFYAFFDAPAFLGLKECTSYNRHLEQHEAQA